MSHSQTDGVKDLLIPLQPVFPLYLCSLYDKAVLERQNTRKQTIKVQTTLTLYPAVLPIGKTS